MKKKIEKTGCESCEINFLNEVDYLVSEVEGYSEEDRLKKKQELDDAFRNSEI